VNKVNNLPAGFIKFRNVKSPDSVVTTGLVWSKGGVPIPEFLAAMLKQWSGEKEFCYGLPNPRGHGVKTPVRGWDSPHCCREGLKVTFGH
jgi:hypothetical protein